jgi:hypothetical protein
MDNYGLAFTRADIEGWTGSPLEDDQLAALVSELEDALDFYFQRDLNDHWKHDLESVLAMTEEAPVASDYIVNEDAFTVGKFFYTRQSIEQVLGVPVNDKVLGFIVEYFDRAFNKYFSEECERLWADIDEIVSEFNGM